MPDSDADNFISSGKKGLKNINKVIDRNLPKKIGAFAWHSGEDAKKALGASLGFSEKEFCIVHS